jgi:phosphatidylinositol-3-phosphatase
VRTARIILLACGALLAGPSTAADTPIPTFEHVIVVVFENKESADVLGGRAAPTFSAYTRRFASMTRYYGVTHPSLPNYLALVSGSTQAITSDCTECIVEGRSLVDTLEGAGRSWKAYLEGLPEPGFLGAVSGRYAKKHNPFAYFRSVIDRPARRARLVSLTQLALDLRARRLPHFSLVVPDLCHSMHDCPVSAGDEWLRQTIPPLLQLPRTVVFIVFDEGVSHVHGGGHVPALVVGTAVRPHARFRRVMDHYGLLRTIEQAWGLPRLGLSARATPITGIWRAGT